jgi:hypothetical protein
MGPCRCPPGVSRLQRLAPTSDARPRAGPPHAAAHGLPAGQASDTGRTVPALDARLLPPGVPLIIVECTLPWPVIAVRDHRVFQVGGLGDTTPAEYSTGGEQVAQFLRAQGADRRPWMVLGATHEAPEAEWGYAPALTEEIRPFGRVHGYQLRRLVFRHPEDLNRVEDGVAERQRSPQGRIRGLPPEMSRLHRKSLRYGLWKSGGHQGSLSCSELRPKISRPVRSSS